MKKYFLCLMVLTSVFYAQAQTKSITLDLLGSSGLAGVSFDSRFHGNQGFGYSVGLAYAYGSSSLGLYTLNGIGIPLEFNYLLGQRNSHLVLGLGMTNGIYKYSTHKIWIGYGETASEIKPEIDNGTYWGYNFFGDVGYRFQRQKGFTFGAGIKPTFAMGNERLRGRLIPYLSLGFSF